MRHLVVLTIWGTALILPCSGMAQARRYEAVRPTICDDFAGRIDPGLESTRLYRELGHPDSLTVLQSETLMGRSHFGMQYVAGHAVVTRTDDRLGVQTRLLLYYHGEIRRSDRQRAVLLVVDDSLELPLGTVELQEHRQGMGVNSVVTQQMIAPLKPSQLFAISQAHRVKGWVGETQFEFSPAELLGIQALHAAVMCGVERV